MFSIAVFTDETNSISNPSYYVLSSPIYKYDPNNLRSSSDSFDYESLCSLKNDKKPQTTFNIIPKEPVNSVFVIPTPTSKIETSKPTISTTATKTTSKTAETTQTTTQSTTITNAKITKFISKTIKTDKVTDKVSVIKMSTTLNQVNLSKERSILVNLIAKTTDCTLNFLSFENSIKSKVLYLFLYKPLKLLI